MDVLRSSKKYRGRNADTNSALDIVPESGRKIGDVTRFAPDYTFYLNLLFTLIAVAMIWLHRRYTKEPGHMQHDMAGDSKTKRVIAMAAAVILISGLLVRIVSDI